MDDKKREIIGEALEVYMRLGIKSVTMDEMARQLGISKKTLYIYVKDKNDLVEQTLEFAHVNEQEQIKKITESTDNAIDELLETGKFIITILKKIHPSIFFDLAKYHPNAMKMMKCNQDEFVSECVESNLSIGIKQGLYRKNINTEVISKVYMAAMDHVLKGNSYEDSKMRPETVYSEFFRYHIRGIASEKGLKYLQGLIKNNDSLH